MRRRLLVALGITLAVLGFALGLLLTTVLLLADCTETCRVNREREQGALFALFFLAGGVAGIVLAVKAARAGPR